MTPRRGRKSSRSCAPARCPRRARRGPTKRPRRRSSPGSRRRSTAPARHGRIRDARRCIGSIAPSTRTPSATCSPSTSTPRRCCRPTIRATASTTSRTCSASRRRCSSATWAPPKRSARWRSAIPSLPPTDQTYRVRFDLTQTRHIDGLPLGTRGGTLVRETFPLDGEYIIKPKLWRTNVGFIRGLAYPHQIEITVDGARVHLVTVGTPEDFATSLMGPQNAVKIIEERMQVRVPIKAGPRTIGVAFVEKSEAMSPTLLRPYLSTLDPVDSEGVPQLEAVTVSGPFSVTGPGDTPSRRRIFSCRPRRRVGRPRASRRAPRPRARATTPPARNRFCRRSRASRIVAPSATPTSARCSPSTKRAARTRTSTPGSSSPSSACSRIRNSCSGPNATRPTWRRARRFASTISSWPHASRSSSGAAFRTSRCWRWPAAASSVTRRCWSNRSGG